MRALLILGALICAAPSKLYFLQAVGLHDAGLFGTGKVIDSYEKLLAALLSSIVACLVLLRLADS